MQRPTIVIVSCMLRSIPLFPGLHSSDWYMGMVEELKPLQIPVTTRPREIGLSMILRQEGFGQREVRRDFECFE